MESKILDKLRKLLRQSEGERAIGNLAAAQTFAAKVQELLTKHKLSMGDIPVLDEATTAEAVGDETVSAGSQRRLATWQLLLITLVAKANECKAIGIPGSNTFHLIGTETNRKMVSLLFSYFSLLAKDLADNETRDVGEGRRFKNAYLYGFAEAVGNRLVEQSNRTEQQAKQLQSSSTALIRLSDNREAVVRYVKEKYKFQSSARPSLQHDGYRMGHAAGSNVALNPHTLKAAV